MHIQYIGPKLKDMWYLLLYPYLTITFGKISFQTPLSITENTAFQVSSCKSTYLCECTRQRVDMFVLSCLMLFEWLALCVRVSVYVWKQWETCGRLQFWVTDEWERTDFWDAQQPLHYNLLLQEPPYTHTHTQIVVDQCCFLWPMPMS